MHRTSLNFIVILFIVLFAGCSSSNKADDHPSRNVNEEIVKLTNLVKDVYKWHETENNKFNGFEPKKNNPSDSLYTGIDLEAADKSIAQLKQTGFFTSEFLQNYRKIAVRMDKELRDGSSVWRVGDLSPFNNEVDKWCNCQDSPDNYWEKLKIVKVRFKNDRVNFKWTWGHKFYYKASAKSEDGVWKINYLEGWDPEKFSWEWAKKHKS